MAIFKATVHDKYAQIPNSTLQDSSISFEARGLLAMMLSMPPDWEVNKAWVINQSKAGKDKVNSIFRELMDAGYIRKCESQRLRGKFASDDYFVFPEPERICRSGQTVDGQTDSGQSATTKETVKQKKQVNKETFTAPSTDGACKVCGGERGQWDESSSKLNCDFIPCDHCNGTGKEPLNPTMFGAAPDPDQPPAKPEKPKSEYPEEFEWIWKNKPGRIGANPKKKAYSACKARIKSGSSWREMAEGMKRYTVHCQSEGKLNTQYVMQMATFFGPDEHFKEQWSVQQPQEYQAPGSEQAGVDAPIYPSQIKNFSSANKTEEGQQQNEKIRQGLGSLRSQLNGEAK